MIRRARVLGSLFCACSNWRSYATQDTNILVTNNQLADFVNELAEASTTNRGKGRSPSVHHVDAKTFKCIASASSGRMHRLRESLYISIHVHCRTHCFFFGNGEAAGAPETSECPRIRRIPEEVKSDIVKALSFIGTTEDTNHEGYSKREEATVKSGALDDILQGLADVLRTVYATFGLHWSCRNIGRCSTHF